VVKRFLNREVEYLGWIALDPHVTQAVRNQVLVSHRYPEAPASRCFRSLARRVAKLESNSPSSDVFVWEKLLNDWVN
jgi:MinD-like ATPase involved in chromosome partitioning or flagellar assembly